VRLRCRKQSPHLLNRSNVAAPHLVRMTFGKFRQSFKLLHFGKKERPFNFVYIKCLQIPQETT
jgi:hypothetical protein